MRRRTLKFIDKGMGSQTPFYKKFTGRQIAVFAVITILSLAAIITYLWYSKTYGNARKIYLEETQAVSYDWQKIASDNNIVTGYLFGKTKNLMLKNNNFIPSNYIIEGRLKTQPAVSSMVFNLSDQALLLKAYVKNGDRSAAITLKNNILESFKTDSGLYLDVVRANEEIFDSVTPTSTSATSNMKFLDSYLDFYSVYGTSKDLEEINSLVNLLFDEKGYIKPEHIVVASYVENSYASSDSYDDEIDTPSLENVYGTEFEGSGEKQKDFDGVKLSDVNLLLIKNLEANQFICKGAYENNLKIVEEGRISDTLPYYSFAYTMEGDKINYIYSAYYAATISVSQSVYTMKNLAVVNKLPDDIYTMFKSDVLNDGKVTESYYIVTGSTGGSEAIDVYSDVLTIAFCKNDTVLFEKVSNIVGRRVATKNTSPALYMIYRTEGERFKFYASENLSIWLTLG